MGFIFTDLVLETIITEGLADMRANLDDRLGIIYDQLKDSFLNTEYGQQELDRFKDFLTNEKIDIVHNYRQVAERIPCIYIQPIGGPEQEGKAFLNDYSGDIDTIGVGGVIDDRKEENTFSIQDQVQVGVHVGDPGGVTALRWLYASLVYFIFSRKEILRDRGIDLSTWNNNNFNRLNEFLPENIVSRYMTFSSINYMSWPKRESELILTQIDMHGGSGAVEPGENKGGVKVEAQKDPEYEDRSMYTIGR
jgi:hypothetical protein